MLRDRNAPVELRRVSKRSTVSKSTRGSGAGVGGVAFVLGPEHLLRFAAMPLPSTEADEQRQQDRG